MNNNILILSAGRRVKLLNAFCQSMENSKTNGIIYCADLQPSLSSACMAAEHHIKLPHILSADYIKDLLDSCLKYNIKVIIPTIDTELPILSDNREYFQSYGIDIIISDTALIEACSDKRKTAHLFHSLSIKTPEIYQPNMIKFPCFTKPALGSSGVGAFKVETEAQLTNSLLSEKDRMFMELIPSYYQEVTIDLYYDKNSQLICAVPRYRIAIRAGEVSKGLTKRGFLYDWCIKNLQTMEGARGCITLQVFVDQATRHISAIEINARFGGGYPLSYSCGADFPAWIIKEYMDDENVSFYDDWKSNMLMLRYDDHILVHDYKWE